MKTTIIIFEGLGYGNYVRRLLIEPLAAKYSFNVGYYHWMSRGPLDLDFEGKLIIVGHSFGGNAALKFAKNYENDIDLLLTLDPRCLPFGGPLRGFHAPDYPGQAVNFYQTRPLRGYKVANAQNYTVLPGHTLVPKRPEVRALVESYLV